MSVKRTVIRSYLALALSVNMADGDLHHSTIAEGESLKSV